MCASRCSSSTLPGHRAGSDRNPMSFIPTLPLELTVKPTIRLASAASCAALILLASPAGLRAQSACARAGACVAVPAFEAAVTDFRVSPAEYGGRLITATVRFTNRLDRPLTLGYVAGSGVSLDDQGNRHV